MCTYQKKSDKNNPISLVSLYHRHPAHIKKRDKRLYEKGAVFESIFTESKDFSKDEFYQLITFQNIKEAVNQKILKIIEKREQIENKIIETQEEEMNTEE